MATALLSDGPATHSHHDEDQTSILLGAASIPSDVILVIFEQLVGDSYTLSNIGLTCRAFRQLSLPCLLRDVDVSSHNNGRVPEEECKIRPVVYADYYSYCRPDSLMPRQHAFLRLILDRPELAVYVQSFTWTLLWEGLDEDADSEIEFETWNVFAQLRNVTRLDLASLHQAFYEHQRIARQDPGTLFPAITDLRLVGWMHRSLARAIITALDTSKLRRLDLDCVQDDGATPNGSPIGDDFSQTYSPRQTGTEDPIFIQNDLYRRQEAGQVFIFPGPMWFTLRILSSCNLERLSYLRIRLNKFEQDVDVRNYHTMFQEIAGFILRVHNTLEALVIIRGECPSHYEEIPKAGPARRHKLNSQPRHLRWDAHMSACFMSQIATALSTKKFPLLANLQLEGFHHIEMAEESQAAGNHLQGMRQNIESAKRNLAMDVDFLNVVHLDHRMPVFNGYEYGGQYDGTACAEILRKS